MSFEGLNEREQQTLVRLGRALMMHEDSKENPLQGIYEMQTVSLHLLAQQVALLTQRSMITPESRQAFFKATLEKLMVLTRIYEKQIKELYAKNQ